MECLVAINPQKKESLEYKELGTVEFGPIQLIFGTIDLEQPDFEPEDPKNAEYVLIRVNAFSCNFRDKSLLLLNYEKMQNVNRSYVPFGSEFCGNIVAIGKDVSDFQVGERVMADCSYPDSGIKGLLPGISTNFASLGWLRLHRGKLIKAPKTMSNVEAACFALGAQTASGMIRRSGILSDNGMPLVFSARSATSLFIIQQLISYGFKPLCLSTSDWSESEINKIYPACVNQMGSYSTKDILEQNITHIFDPFFDMNIGQALEYLQVGGKYITCGLRDQHPLLSKNAPVSVEPTVRFALTQSICKNITILGNCLGSTADLERAIRLQNKMRTGPIIDQEYTLKRSIEFINRSFFNSGRFGKCVLNYEMEEKND